MPRRTGRRKERGPEIRNLKIMNALLILIVAGLVIYIMWPSIKLAIAGQPLGKTLSGINAPLSPAQLSVINNAPDSYFERAGETVLNGSLPGEGVSNGVYYATSSNFQLVLGRVPQFPTFNENGKPSVIYIGATSCLWCGENRWAMALALSRFGSFNSLYIGYSAIHDADLPTLYWKPQELYVNGSTNFGNRYSSPYINFFSVEYDSNITSGFQFPPTSDPIGYFISRAPNSSYEQAMSYMNATQSFSGTPFTSWGSVINRGASGVVLGTAQNSSVSKGGDLPLTYMTHQQIFNQLQNLNTTFAYEEYAVADIYVAELCPSIGNSAPVCGLPAIQAYEQKMGLA
ncbi:MAG: DUF929 family protein [Candidatus Micrarchaeota archaeon]|nr:DUF929 family protein [Candidatus Micrarchaeota archaeon]